jgi:hypothetical protein
MLVLTNANYQTDQLVAYLRGDETDTGTLSLLLVLYNIEHFRIGVLKTVVEELFMQHGSDGVSGIHREMYTYAKTQ